MRLQPEILAYFGFSDSLVKMQLEYVERYEKAKNWSAEVKIKNDSELWTNWLREYLNRVYDDINNSNESNIISERIRLMNSNNPR